MKVLINSNDYECQDVRCTSKQQSNGVFLLTGIDLKLIDLAREGIDSKMYFDVVIKNGTRIFLDGESAFFHNLSIQSNEVELHVNWIN